MSKKPVANEAPASSKTGKSDDQEKELNKHMNKMTLDELKSSGKSKPEPTIGILYRHDGNGAGAYFDLHQIRKIFPTFAAAGRIKLIVLPSVSQIHPEYEQQFRTFVETPTFRGGKSLVAEASRSIAPGDDSMSKSKESGLDRVLEELLITKGINFLFVPGFPRELEKHGSFNQYRTERIACAKFAMEHDIPVLGVCGGAWDVLLACAAIENRTAPDPNLNLLVDARGHACRQGMPSLTKDGTVGYDIQMHDVYPVGRPAELHSVNSVHWLVPREPLPAYTTVTYMAKHNPLLCPYHRNPGKFTDGYCVLDEVVEAFDYRRGGRVIGRGVLWHPETAADGTDDWSTRQKEMFTSMLVTTPAVSSPPPSDKKGKGKKEL